MKIIPLGNVRGRKGDQGNVGPQGLPGSNALTNDAATGTYVSTSGTATQNALKAWTRAQAPRQVNVVDYGADPTGATDSTNAVKAALTALKNAGGGVLIYPPGLYQQATVELISDLTVTGPGATITTTSNGYFAFLSRSNGVKGYGSGASRVTFDRLTFKGDFATNRQCNITLHHSSDVTFSGCVFEQCYTSAHILDIMGCDGIQITGCTFAGWKPEAGREYAEAIQIDHSWRQGGDFDSAGSYDGLPTRNVLIDGNEFRPLTIGATVYEAPASIGNHASLPTRPSGIKIVNNRFIGIGRASGAVGANGGGAGVVKFASGVVGLTVAKNTFDGTGLDARAIYVGSATVGIASGANFDDASISAVSITPRPPENVVIEGNVLAGFYGTASSQNLISVVSTAAAPGKTVVITGNTISNSATDAAAEGSWGIRVFYCNGVTVTGNTLRTLQRGVSFVGVRTGVASNNTLETIAHLALDFTDACFNITVASNNAVGVGGGIRVSSAVQAFTISSNTIWYINSSTVGTGGINIYASTDGIVNNNNLSAASSAVGSAIPGIRVVAGANNGVTAGRISIKDNRTQTFTVAAIADSAISATCTVTGNEA